MSLPSCGSRAADAVWKRGRLMRSGRSMPMTDVRAILRRFDAPDEVRDFELGRFEVVRLAGTAIGRATYQPGWRWSTHVGPALGLSRCQVEHVGLVLSGVATAAFTDGEVTELHAGDLFH